MPHYAAYYHHANLLMPLPHQNLSGSLFIYMLGLSFSFFNLCGAKKNKVRLLCLYHLPGEKNSLPTPGLFGFYYLLCSWTSCATSWFQPALQHSHAGVHWKINTAGLGEPCLHRRTEQGLEGRRKACLLPALSVSSGGWRTPASHSVAYLLGRRGRAIAGSAPASMGAKTENICVTPVLSEKRSTLCGRFSAPPSACCGRSQSLAGTSLLAGTTKNARLILPPFARRLILSPYSAYTCPFTALPTFSLLPTSPPPAARPFHGGSGFLPAKPALQEERPPGICAAVLFCAAVTSALITLIEHRVFIFFAPLPLL